MGTWLLILGIGGIALVAVLQYRTASRSYTPLTKRQPERHQREVPLGLEAMDMDHISSTNRRNESLERGRLNWLGNLGTFGRTDAEVLPLSDDETYAARYHTAFQKDKSED